MGSDEWYQTLVPAKNVLKLYLENSYYHVYNRGVEKRIIFMDDLDYRYFLNLLKIYLEPKVESELFQNQTIYPRRPLNNFYGEIELIAFCLMPNHFHLLVHQKSSKSIEIFMRSLLTKYSMYFNKRHSRVGHLYQGPYKAVLVENDSQLLHLTRYIHLNPLKKDYPLQVHFRLKNAYSSYAIYIGERTAKWVNTKEILSFFKTSQKSSPNRSLTYESFVEDSLEETPEAIKDLTIDS